MEGYTAITVTNWTHARMMEVARQRYGGDSDARCSMVVTDALVWLGDQRQAGQWSWWHRLLVTIGMAKWPFVSPRALGLLVRWYFKELDEG